MKYAMFMIIVFFSYAQFQQVQSAPATNRSGREVQDWDRFIERANALREDYAYYKQIINEFYSAPTNLTKVLRPQIQINWKNQTKPVSSGSFVYQNDSFKDKIDNNNVEISLSLVPRSKQRLLLSGCQPLQLVSASAIDYVRDILAEHLDAPDLAAIVIHAQRLDDGILFEMETTAATLQVLEKAKTLLQGACFYIESTNTDFSTVAQHIRFGF